MRLFAHYDERDTKGFLAESLWKYLLATELALAVEDDVSRRPAGSVPDDPEWKLTEFISENEAWIKRDFASRLELAVTNLAEVGSSEGVADVRARISEVLHQGPLRRLREVLAPVLAERERVSIIIDNLDKAWDKEADAPSSPASCSACSPAWSRPSRHGTERQRARRSDIPLTLYT